MNNIPEVWEDNAEHWTGRVVDRSVQDKTSSAGSVYTRIQFIYMYIDKHDSLENRMYSLTGYTRIQFSAASKWYEVRR